MKEGSYQDAPGYTLHMMVLEKFLTIPKFLFAILVYSTILLTNE